MARLDILNLEWPHSDRDRHIITPVYLYLKKKYHLTVKSKNVFNGYYYLLRYRPKLLLLSNSVGTEIHFFLTKIAKTMGIPAVSLMSEGNLPLETFKDDASSKASKKTIIDGFFFGLNNKDKILYEDLRIVWSQKSKDLFTLQYPSLKGRILASGATGFDKYALLSFLDKQSFLSKYNFNKYKKTVGLAGWGFDLYFESNFGWKQNKEYLTKAYSDNQINMHRKDLGLVKDIYKKLVERNKDTIFIARPHPATSFDIQKTEFADLNRFPNVHFSFPAKDYLKESVSDLINISDIWIAYNSTTALEAWLLGKTTFFINPTRKDFTREAIYKGNPIASGFEEAQKFISAFFKDGRLPEFEALANERSKIIKDVIEYNDGKNHIRAAEIIYSIFKQLNERTRRITYRNFPFARMARQCFGFYRSNNKNVALDVELYESLYTQPIRAEIQHETSQT